MAAASGPRERGVVDKLRVRAGADKVVVLAAIATSETRSARESAPIPANPICA